jgi:hypothetical protein
MFMHCINVYKEGQAGDWLSVVQKTHNFWPNTKKSTINLYLVDDAPR